MKKLNTFYILFFFYTVPGIFTISEVAVFHNKILFDHILERHTGCVEDVIHCGKLCSYNLMCMSFFYKAGGLPICQLHSTVLTDIDKARDVQGWLYYVFDDDRCPYQDEDGFLLDRIAGICIRYMKQSVSYQQMKNNCQRLNATVLNLTSSHKEKRVVEIIGKVWPVNQTFLIQGWFNQSWQFDDGINMTYFNWAPGLTTKSIQQNFWILMRITSGNNIKPTSEWYPEDGKWPQMNYICEKL